MAAPAPSTPGAAPAAPVSVEVTGAKGAADAGPYDSTAHVLAASSVDRMLVLDRCVQAGCHRPPPRAGCAATRPPLTRPGCAADVR
jgi:hypothetical protein